MSKKIVWIALVVASCNNPGKKEQPLAKNGNEIAVQQPGFDPAEAVDIIGTWLQQSTHYDENNNAVLDEAEKQKEGPPMGFNYFLFKNDGTCVRDKDIRFEGNYDIMNKDGKRSLEIQTVPPGETYKYTISGPVVNDVLVLHSSGAFLVYKKE
jgi:hypothetical protein